MSDSFMYSEMILKSKKRRSPKLLTGATALVFGGLTGAVLEIGDVIGAIYYNLVGRDSASLRRNRERARLVALTASDAPRDIAYHAQPSKIHKS
jgi:hypothetical protein